MPAARPEHAPAAPRRGALALAVVAALVAASATTVHGQGPGDVDCDGAVTAADATALVDVLFDRLRACVARDVNGDGSPSSADLAALPRLRDLPQASGPRIVFVGIAAASGRPVAELGRLGSTPVYFRNAGSGFRIVVEAAEGDNGSRPGRTTVRLDDTSVRPDLQIVCNRPLGDGDPAVCDGGVPAVAAPHIDPTLATTITLNDLGCPFEAFTAPRVSCTLDDFGNPNFVEPNTRVQFCAQIARTLEFPPGDTLCSVQVRDVAGIPGPLASWIVRVGDDPNPPTFTPTALASATPTRAAATTPTRTVTTTRSHTPTRTRTPTLPSPSTATPTPSVGAPTAAATATHTPTRPPTPLPSRTALSTSTPTHTASPTRTPTRSLTPTRERSATPTPTFTITRSPTRTRTATRTPTRSETPTRTATATATRTPTRTATPTPTGLRGPRVTYFGLARADDSVVEPSGTTGNGLPIFERPAGSGFRIVVEGRAGPSGLDPGEQAYDFSESRYPDLQIFSSRPLGDGSAAVCDRIPPNAGGIPAVDPADFDGSQRNIDAANDFGCRFRDGGGNPFGRRSSDDACTQFPPDSGLFRFVSPAATIQFCGLVDSSFAFPPGDTVLTVRLRDILFNPGEPRSIVVRNTDSLGRSAQVAKVPLVD